VTKKITRSIANILAKKQNYLYLGNLDAKRDWGFAPEYVEVMWKMLQSSETDDYIIGTGKSHSVREFLDQAFSYAGLSYEKYVITDKRYLRPTEVYDLTADSTKAQKKLAWNPVVSFSELVKIMVDADMRKIGLKPIGEGDQIIARKFPQKWWKGD
jgi:GDPmannose 4,6-dehydratase